MHKMQYSTGLAFDYARSAACARPSSQGFQYCDLLLAMDESKQVLPRAKAVKLLHEQASGSGSS